MFEFSVLSYKITTWHSAHALTQRYGTWLYSI